MGQKPQKVSTEDVQAWADRQEPLSMAFKPYHVRCKGWHAYNKDFTARPDSRDHADAGREHCFDVFAYQNLSCRGGP